MPEHKKSFYEKNVKRLLDCCFALIAIILLSPVLGVIALLVRIKLGAPVIFRQDRPGLQEKIFHLYKFRTMTDERDPEGNLLPDEKRLTKFGRFLRASSLDELPELVNILKGNMSVVGPRPLLVRYLPYYTEEERHRHDVRPGITGLAQINGRNFLNWEERFTMDVQYAQNISFVFDVKIILKTIAYVFRRSGVLDRSDAEAIKHMSFQDLDQERKDRQL